MAKAERTLAQQVATIKLYAANLRKAAAILEVPAAPPPPRDATREELIAHYNAIQAEFNEIPGTLRALAAELDLQIGEGLRDRANDVERRNHDAMRRRWAVEHPTAAPAA